MQYYWLDEISYQGRMTCFIYKLVFFFIKRESKKKGNMSKIKIDNYYHLYDISRHREIQVSLVWVDYKIIFLAQIVLRLLQDFPPLSKELRIDPS